MNKSEFICPCGGGQSCIIDRRKNNDWVYEDYVFSINKLPLRKHCFQKYYRTQSKVLKFICPCGGGQSCIVDRRKNNDWVHEDYVFLNNKLPLRKHCFQKYYKSQLKVLFPN